MRAEKRLRCGAAATNVKKIQTIPRSRSSVFFGCKETPLR
jgi:hypothetical protein